MKKFNGFLMFLFFCLVCSVGVSAADVPSNQLHYQIPTGSLPDLAPYSGNYTSIGDSIRFTAYFYDVDGNQKYSETVNVTDDRHLTQDGYINAPTKLGYCVIILYTGVYDRSGSKWKEIIKRCPGNTDKGEERAFWFDPDHPINSTFVFTKTKNESLYGGIEYFKLYVNNVTIETFSKK